MLLSRSPDAFTIREILGVFVIVEASCLSIAAVSFILCLALYRWLRRVVYTWRRPGLRNPDASDSSLFRNLMVADFIQATGNLPSIKWLLNAHITEGRLCTAQAAAKQVGIVGVSMTSLAIAVHTFSVLILRWKAPHRASRWVVVAIWVFVALDIGIPNAIHRNEKYYGKSGYWCWLEDEFRVEQIVTEYLWVWIAALTMTILYTIMFVLMRGWFIIDNGIHWHKSYKPAHSIATLEMETNEEKQTKAVATLMLFYPAVYIFCILPNSIARWMTLTGSKPPYEFTLSANFLFALSGTFNATVFFITRPGMVIGSDSPTEFRDLSTHETDTSSRSTRKLGHLPDRGYEDVPTTGDVAWGNQPDFDPRSMVADHDIRTSLLGYDTPLPPAAYTQNTHQMPSHHVPSPKASFASTTN